MPQANDELRSEWGDLHVAWDYLQRRRFTQRECVISPPAGRESITPKESRAIDYLFHEWDYMTTHMPPVKENE